jgi:hypothetical protein
MGIPRYFPEMKNYQMRLRCGRRALQYAAFGFNLLLEIHEAPYGQRIL